MLPRTIHIIIQATLVLKTILFFSTEKFEENKIVVTIAKLATTSKEKTK